MSHPSPTQPEDRVYAITFECILTRNAVEDLTHLGETYCEYNFEKRITSRTYFFPTVHSDEAAGTYDCAMFLEGPKEAVKELYYGCIRNDASIKALIQWREGFKKQRRFKQSKFFIKGIDFPVMRLYDELHNFVQ